MALRHPWLGDLIEAELDEVVVWKAKVKQEPGTPRIASIGRLSDDGSNFRSSADRSDLESQSELQIVRAYVSKIGQCLVSDGQVQVRATLTSEAWSAYEAGLETGQEPSQGDLICCQQLSVISTPFGPSDERIQLRIEQLEYVGKYRKTLGDPQPVNQRPRIQQLLEEITRIRAEQDDDHSVPLAGHAAAAATRFASGAAAANGGPSQIAVTGADDHAARSQSHRSSNGGASGHAHVARSGSASSPHSLIATQEREGNNITTPGRPEMVTSHALHHDQIAEFSPSSEVPEDQGSLRKASDLGEDPGGVTSGKALLNLLRKTTNLPTKPAQISTSTGVTSGPPATKRRKLSHDTILTPGTQGTFGTQAANPRRRKPASLDHDGVGMAEGVNNAGPIPPTTRRIAGENVAQLPIAEGSHSSPSPAHAAEDRMEVAHDDDAPTSAQVVAPDVAITPRPRSRQRLTHSATKQPAAVGSDLTIQSSSLRLRPESSKRHKIPANQMALLEAKTCHVPPMPGQSLPHPNVPVAVLQAWNRHYQASNDAAAPARQGSTTNFVVPSLQNAASPLSGLAAQAGEEHSSSSDSDESEIIPWSQSPSQRALPLDSSAGAPIQESHDTPSKRPRLSLGSATVSGSQKSVTMRNGIFGVSGLQSAACPARRPIHNNSTSTHTAGEVHEVSQIAMRPSPNKRSSTQAECGTALSPPAPPKRGNGPTSRASNSSQASASSVSQRLHGSGAQRTSRRPSDSESVRARLLENAAPAGAPTGPRPSRVQSVQVRARTTSMTASGSPRTVATQPDLAATQFNVQRFSQVVPSTNYEAPACSPRIQTAPSTAIASPRRTNIGPDSHSQVPGRDHTILSQPGDEARNHGVQRPSSASSLLSRSERFPSGHSAPGGPSASQQSSSRLRLDDAATTTDRRALRLFDEPVRSQTPGTTHEFPQQAFGQVHPSPQTLVEQSPVKTPACSAGSPGSCRPGSQPVPRGNRTWVRVGQPNHRTSGTELVNATSAQSSPADNTQDGDRGQAGSSQRNGQKQGGHQRDDHDRSDLYPGQSPRTDHTRSGDSYRPSYGLSRPSTDTSRIPHPLPRKPATQTPNSSDELPVEAPKPLDYREAHQERRRDFFRGEQRKQWLRDKVSLETSIVHVLPWLAEYRKSYLHDPVTAEQFAAIVSRLCPHIGLTEHGAALENTPDDTEVPNVSPPLATTDHLPHTAEALHNAPPPAASSRPVYPSGDGNLSTFTSTTSRSQSFSSRRNSRRSLPWATLPEEPTIEVTASASTAQSAAPRTLEITQAVGPVVTTTLANEIVQRTAASEVTMFTEFARAWHAVKPGGAFARPAKTASRSRAASGRLNVLAWGFGR
ncbi:hypothetical protein LTR95_004229 [Oleoguttula sp. CCFEE 5521]